MLLILVVLRPAPTTVVVLPPGQGVAGGETPKQADKEKERVVPPPTPPTPTPPTPTPIPPQPTPPPQPKEEQIAAQLKDAVFLVQVEKANNFWPFATCCAIGENTLLTSAREAYQLAQWQADPQMSGGIWVTNPTSGIKMAVQEIRVHAEFMRLGERPNDWIYFDVALLTVAERLPKIAPLASPEELGELRSRLSVYCLGFGHEGEKGERIADFADLRPQAALGSIFLITAPPTLPLQPRLLHVKGKFPKNMCGSPIVNEQGKVVAVYGANPRERDLGEPAGQGAVEIHFAPVLNWDVTNLWLQQRDAKVWVSPDVGKSRSGSSDQR
jgi:hypothetical protein